MFKKIKEDYYSIKEALLLDKSYVSYLDASACKQGGDAITHAKLALDKAKAYDDMTKNQKVMYHTVKGLKPVAKFGRKWIGIAGLLAIWLIDKEIMVVNPELLDEEE